MVWSLVFEPVGRTGAENMALDETLLRDADRTGAAYLRLYRWSPPCLSFGRNEPALGRYDRAAIERLGLDVVRRPTGGRAVWHDQEVTYAVAAPVTAFGSLREAYRVIHQRIADALVALGAPATLAPRHTPAEAAISAGACFTSPVGGEVVVRGRKVVGSAQVRHGRAFLQHGSILLDGSQEVIQAISRQPSGVSAATTLSAAVGRRVAFREVADAIVATWASEVAPTVPYRPLPSPTAPYADPAWTWRR